MKNYLLNIVVVDALKRIRTWTWMYSETSDDLFYSICKILNEHPYFKEFNFPFIGDYKKVSNGFDYESRLKVRWMEIHHEHLNPLSVYFPTFREWYKN